MSWVQDKEKNPSSRQELNLDLLHTGQDAPTTKQWRPRGKLPHVQARFIYDMRPAYC